MDNNFEEKLKELRKGYLKKLETEVVELKDLLNVDEINVFNVYSKVHKISGTSGMYGLNELSNTSNIFEVYLKEILKQIEENANSINNSDIQKKLSDYIAYIEDTIGRNL